MAGRTLKRFFHSWFFSLLILLILVGALLHLARNVTETYHREPDFGGMVILRQADMKLDDTSVTSLRLTRDMILNYVTSREVLEPIAKHCGWNESFEEMQRAIDVKDRLSATNSFIVVADTKLMRRSVRLARELSLSFLEYYRKKWHEQSRNQLALCDERLAKLQQELCDLKKLNLRFQDKSDLRPLNTEIEMAALNEQLVEAQKQFLSAYGTYITGLEAKRAELQLEYDMARQIYTENALELKHMKLKLMELNRQCEVSRKRFSEQRPDIYRLTMNPQKLENTPNDIVYYYENIQTLQQLKLALMLGGLIDDKEAMLTKEQQKKNTIERLLSSNSCDVFIREVTQ